MAQEKLDPEVQTYIVQALACYDSPKTVADAVKAEFGIVVARQKVEAYDPTKRAAKSLGAKWIALFEATRKEFLEDTGKIAASHRAVRLRALQRMAEKAENMGNMALAAGLYEQIAKEMGDAYTNRRELTGKGGAPLPTAPAVVMYALPDNGRS